MENGNIVPESFGIRQRVSVDIFDHGGAIFVHFEDIGLFVSTIVLIIAAHDHYFGVSYLDSSAGRQRDKIVSFYQFYGWVNN